jgi:long-chain acyl-CoA synthetase
MMPNVLQYPVATAAFLRAGMTVVNVNPLYTPRELEHQLNDSGAEAIVILENFATTLEKVDQEHARQARHPRQHGRHARLPEGRDRQPGRAQGEEDGAGLFVAAGGAVQGRGRGRQGQAAQHARDLADDVAFLQYTGGTTGVSKGATLLHRNIVANVLQNDLWLQPALSKEPKVDQLFIVTALPLYHIFALTACFLLAMRSGGVCLLIPNPRDIPNLVKELSKYKVNKFPAVNTLYNALLNHPDFGKIDFSMLKASNGGGMAVQRAVAERWLKATGCPIIEGYGLSETSPVLTCNRATTTNSPARSACRCRRPRFRSATMTATKCRSARPGEICARGPQVMAGYWQRPEETAQVMTKDGFFRTGDIGVMDEKGMVKIVDRKKDMVLVSASTSIRTRSRT